MTTWSIQTNPPGSKPAIIAEYLLNDLGLYVRREQRMPKGAPLTAVTGFRVGYAAVPGTDYRAAPMDRDVLLWRKVTSVTDNGDGSLTVCGNRSGAITVVCPPEMRDDVIRTIADMRRRNPPVAAADPEAAAWICWRDDDEWDEPLAPLSDMVRDEAGMNRYIEPEILEETVLPVMPDYAAAPGGAPPAPPAPASVRPNFCAECGAPLTSEGIFCGSCGARIM